MFNWSFIIISALRILEIKIAGRLFAFLGLILILAAISGTFIEKNIRMGFFVSLLVAAVIGLVAIIMQKVVWKKEKKKEWDLTKGIYNLQGIGNAIYVLNERWHDKCINFHLL